MSVGEREQDAVAAYPGQGWPLFGGRAAAVYRDPTGTVARWSAATLSNLDVCCPECRDRVGLVRPYGVALHHAEDGTQCPGTWPDYVLGHPYPARPAPAGSTLHTSMLRGRRRR